MILDDSLSVCNGTYRLCYMMLYIISKVLWNQCSYACTCILIVRMYISTQVCYLVTIQYVFICNRITNMCCHLVPHICVVLGSNTGSLFCAMSSLKSIHSKSFFEELQRLDRLDGRYDTVPDSFLPDFEESLDAGFRPTVYLAAEDIQSSTGVGSVFASWASKDLRVWRRAWKRHLANKKKPYVVPLIEHPTDSQSTRMATLGKIFISRHLRDQAAREQQRLSEGLNPKTQIVPTHPYQGEHSGGRYDGHQANFDPIDEFSHPSSPSDSLQPSSLGQGRGQPSGWIKVRKHGNKIKLHDPSQCH